MSMLILLSVIVLATSEVTPAVEEAELCTVEDVRMNCVCTNNEEFVVNALLVPIITHMSVKGCHKVLVPFSAMIFSELEVLEFSEIDEIFFASFALASVKSINNLFLSNINDLQLVENSFTGISNVSKFHMKNVVATTIPKSSFYSIMNINEFRIENCTFKHVHEEAFAVYDVDNFEITDSEICYLESRAIAVENVSNLVLSANDFSEVSNVSFYLHLVDNFFVHDCQFSVLGSWAFNGNVKVMNFSYNHISVLKSFVFLGMELTDSVVFENNIVHTALDGSLEPFIRSAYAKSVNVTYCCNKFTCDCGISWLWNPLEPKEFKGFLDESKCIEDETNALGYYVPILDYEEVCAFLELQSLQELGNGRGVRSKAQNLRNYFNYYAITVFVLYVLYKV